MCIHFIRVFIFEYFPHFLACLIIQIQCCEQQNSAMQIVCSKLGCVLPADILDLAYPDS